MVCFLRGCVYVAALLVDFTVCRGCHAAGALGVWWGAIVRAKRYRHQWAGASKTLRSAAAGISMERNQIIARCYLIVAQNYGLPIMLQLRLPFRRPAWSSHPIRSFIRVASSSIFCTHRLVKSSFSFLSFSFSCSAMLSCRVKATISSCISSTNFPLPRSSSTLSFPRRSRFARIFSSWSMRCFWRVSDAWSAASSVFTAPSLASSSPRVRWVDASSERIWASEEGGAASAEAEDAFPLGVLGRGILVPAVGVGAVSSPTADAGWLASVAVRSASLVS
jgi:hypothetical protein